MSYEEAANIPDRRFEKEGENTQLYATNWQEAWAEFDKSCTVCLSKEVGAHSCEGCKIRGMFLNNAEIFKDELSEFDLAYVEAERQLM